MSKPAIRNDSRGRSASKPREIPKKGWREILTRVKNDIGSDNVPLISASIAFFGLLALFPAIAATIAIGGLIVDPHQIEQQIDAVSDMLPPEAATIITDQATQVAENTGGGLAFAAIVGILFALYAASKGLKALIQGLNIIYNEDEKRGFIKLNLTAFILTLGLILLMILAFGLIALLPAVVGVLGLGSEIQWLVSLASWPVLFLFAILGYAVIYHYGPSRDRPQWRWISWGSVLGVLVWVVGSLAFSIYVSNFGNFNETYGSLGAVIILLLWFWLSAFSVLLGGELNSEMEHQTEYDTTVGEPEPMGGRGAYMADTRGRNPP
jgi:membrane protein